MTADDMAALTYCVSNCNIQATVLEKGLTTAAAEAQERKQQKMEAMKKLSSRASNSLGREKKSKKRAEARRARRKNSVGQGIRKGWSPAVIRGTSVTAHTHTSSSHVLAAPHHQQLEDSESVSEQQLDTGIEVALGLSRGGVGVE